jgi:hypothetical protein
MLFNFKKYFLNSLYLENKKKIFYIYLLYIGLIIFSSIVYGYLLNSKFEIYDSNYNIILKNVSFSNGELIYNLLYKKKYFINYRNNIDFYLAKTSAIPLFIFFLTLFSKNFFYIMISKNLIIFTIYFYFVYKALLTQKVKNYFFLLILIIPVIIPYNFSVSLNFFYEDSLIAILLPLLFLAIITNYKHKYLLISGLCFILYFVKTSMFLIIAVLPILIIFLEREKKILKFLPGIFSLLAILMWGFYGLNKTGRFPIFSSGSSINSHVLAYAMNKNFHKFYPNKSSDLIPFSYEMPNNITNEWEFFDFYEKKNIEYLDQNLSRYLKDIIIKLKFIFFGINRDGVLPDKNGNFDNSIRFSLILSKLLFNLSILFSLLILFKNIKKIFSQKREIFFLSLVILNLLPHIFVWATSKHLVAISNITMMYLIFCFVEKKNKNNL